MEPELTKPVADADALFKRPENPSQYIRTYAKDVAGLTGAPAPTPSPVASIPKEPDPVVVKVPAEPLPAFVPAPPPPVPEEKSEAPKDTAILSKQAEVFDVTLESNVPDKKVGEEKTEVLEDRESVLARLRAKFAPSVAENYISNHPELAPSPSPAFVPPPVVAEVAPPLPPPPPVEQAQPPAPSAFTRAEVIPPTSTPTPFTGNRSALPSATEEVPSAPIHTYTSDFADHIDEKKASTFAVLAAQSDAELTPRTSSKKSTLLPVISGIVLVLAGLGVTYGGYWYLRNNIPDVLTTLSTSSLIEADQKIPLRGTGAELLQALVGVTTTAGLGDGQVAITYTTPSNSTAPEAGGVLVRALPLGAPDILLRNIDDSSVIGVINADGDTKPYFILRTTSYERTFAGMLVWEKTILTDLSSLYPGAGGGASFTDSVVLNHDVRIARGTDGTTLLVYGYVDKETFIIARNESAFTSLVHRLSTKRN